MIVSVSRRTDIPAFYSDWFFDQLKEGQVLVPNPFNKKQISTVSLRPNDVDCFVFWSKDPKSMVDRLHLLNDFDYYFQFTITSYGRDIETNLRTKDEIVTEFQRLSDAIGTDKVIWRYDPILLNSTYTKEFHFESFERLASQLSGYTNVCFISFIDTDYRNVKRNATALQLSEIHDFDMLDIGHVFSEIGRRYNIKIHTCVETVDLSQYGIMPGACIDKNLIERITNKKFSSYKLDNQRPGCNCLTCKDIGQYNTCAHGCLYCYANYSKSGLHMRQPAGI